MADYCFGLEEVYAKSSAVVVDPDYGLIGLTDTAICRIVESDTQVLTVDHKLSEGSSRAASLR